MCFALHIFRLFIPAVGGVSYIPSKRNFRNLSGGGDDFERLGLFVRSGRMPSLRILSIAILPRVPAILPIMASRSSVTRILASSRTWIKNGFSAGFRSTASTPLSLACLQTLSALSLAFLQSLIARPVSSSSSLLELGSRLLEATIFCSFCESLPFNRAKRLAPTFPC